MGIAAATNTPTLDALVGAASELESLPAGFCFRSKNGARFIRTDHIGWHGPHFILVSSGILCSAADVWMKHGGMGAEIDL